MICIPNLILRWFLPVCLFSGAILANESRVVPDQFTQTPYRHLTGSLLARDGSFWVVAEDGGVARCWLLGKNDEWIPGDYYKGYPSTANFYGIAEDRQGRIWVGTDNKGVAVFNGTSWQTYGRAEGLPGERIFSIAVSPKNGHVALATSGGVCIYQPESEKWLVRNRSHGLVEDQVEDLCFSEDGTLWLAYSCGGVSWSSADKGYSKWDAVQAPWYFDRDQLIRQSVDASGKGLPSNLCNAIVAASDGRILAGTACGLAVRGKSGEWHFIRGADYRKKSLGSYQFNKAGRYRPPQGKQYLPEDYVTCIAEADEGFWIGFREKGVALIDKKSLTTIKQIEFPAKANSKVDSWVTSISVFPDGSVLATRYGGGITILRKGSGHFQMAASRSQEVTPFPREAVLTGEEGLVSQLKRAMNTGKPSPHVATYLKEDWATLGDWCERYGMTSAELFATNAPHNHASYIDSKHLELADNPLYVVPYDPEDPADKSQFAYGYYDVFGASGILRSPDDCLRAWVHWIKANGNRNVLYNAYTGNRTESEWDDQGEAYPRDQDGPDIWLITFLPEGRHLVSLYFFNPNGRMGINGYRDYLIEMREYTPRISLRGIGYPFKTKTGKNVALPELVRMQKSPVVARARVRNFAGAGVYKTFIVEGNRGIAIRICRNNSFNTIINGLFIERMEKPSERNRTSMDLCAWYDGIAPFPGRIKLDLLDNRQRALLEVWDSLSTAGDINKRILAAFNQAMLDQYRLEAAKDGESPFRENIKWYTGIWEDGDHDRFDEIMRSSWDQKQENRLVYRSREFFPHSRGTVPFSLRELREMDKRKMDWKKFRSLHPEKDRSTIDEIKKQLIKNNEN